MIIQQLTQKCFDLYSTQYLQSTCRQYESCKYNILSYFILNLYHYCTSSPQAMCQWLVTYRDSGVCNGNFSLQDFFSETIILKDHSLLFYFRLTGGFGSGLELIQETLLQCFIHCFVGKEGGEGEGPLPPPPPKVPPTPYTYVLQVL